MGAHFWVLQGAGKGAAESGEMRAQRNAERRKRERGMAGVGRVTGGKL
jgi:hypothetical protein